jgi:hypothetical protein
VLIVADHTTADYALVDVRDGDMCGSSWGEFFSNVAGETTVTLKLKIGGVTALYAALRNVTAPQKYICQVSGISLCCDNNYAIFGKALERGLDFNGWFMPQPVKVRQETEMLHQALVSRSRGWLDKWKNRWKRSKVSGTHHTWFRPEEVYRVCAPKRNRLMKVALERMTKFKETEAFVSGYLLWTGTADLKLAWYVALSSEIDWSGSVEKWAKSVKGLTADVKAHNGLAGINLTHLFELQVLANRGIGSVDWGQERLNRTKPTLVDMPFGAIKKASKEIFMQGRLDGFKYASQSWSKFWRRRWGAIPTGSIHSQHEEDNKYIDRDDRLKKTKHYTLLKMPDRGLEYWTRRQPEIQAWASVKYEWAKERAIYGTDLTSYLLTDFVMPGIEEALSTNFPVGRRSTEEYVHRRIELAGVGGVPFCYDYQDFNSQHSLAAQRAVVEGFVEAFWQDMSEEQRAAAWWVMRSVTRQSVHVDGTQYDTAGTLLSGWRLTTVVNTVLNRVYLQLAGCLEHCRDAVHNGDDVLAFVSTMADAVQFSRKAADAGIRAQAEKCNIGSIAEFLRVDRAASDANGSQYLARGVATAVHARTESNAPPDVYNYLNSQRTRIEELRERGADSDVVDGLLSRAGELAKVIYNLPSERAQAMLETHKVHGGLSDKRDAPVKWWFKVQKYREHEARPEERDRLPGVTDYANYLADMFALSGSVKETVNRAVRKATEAMVSVMKSEVKFGLVQDKHRAWAEQQMSGVCAGEIAVQAFSGQARLAGLPAGRLPIELGSGSARARIASSNDVIRTLRVIF